MTFNSGPLVDCQGRLQHDYGELARLWAAVREDWRDEQCRRFEQEYLQSLGPCLGRLTASLTDFVETIHRADRELEDNRESATD